MQKLHWSKAFWTTMFAVALNYPLEPLINDQYNYKRFYEDVQYILPCDRWKRMYRHALRRMPINPFLREGRKSLFYWVLKIHNIISDKRELPQLTKEDVFRVYFPTMHGLEVHEQLGGGNGQSAVADTVALAVVGITGAAAGFYIFSKLLK